jgi:uncharacterized protein (UPF0332 family)
VSPRSDEFLASARDRLRAAGAAAEGGFAAVAVSAAYYAVLYAARALLSEAELNAKTHTGTWSLFAKHFVASGEFEDDLYAAVRRLQELRERADYDARDPTPEEATGAVSDAKRFVNAVEQLLD